MTRPAVISFSAIGSPRSRVVGKAARPRLFSREAVFNLGWGF